MAFPPRDPVTGLVPKKKLPCHLCKRERDDLVRWAPKKSPKQFVCPLSDAETCVTLFRERVRKIFTALGRPVPKRHCGLLWITDPDGKKRRIFFRLW